MKVRVCYDSGIGYGEFEYYSRYNRINAKGIKEEIRYKMYMLYGSKSYDYEITSFYRV